MKSPKVPLYNLRTPKVVEKPRRKKPVLITPYQFSKLHPEVASRPQAIYQHCLKQAAPHVREKSGRIVIDEEKFLKWFNDRVAQRLARATHKLAKSA